MTLITVQDGKIVMRDGKIGTEQACCCGKKCCDCCMVLQSRNLCEFGEIGEYGEDWETWGAGSGDEPGSSFGGWDSSTGWGFYGPTNVPSFGYSLIYYMEFYLSGCDENGNRSLTFLSRATELFGLPFGGPGARVTERTWSNVTLTYGEDGCQVGVNLGDYVETCTEECAETEPLTPTVSFFDCNPLP